MSEFGSTLLGRGVRRGLFGGHRGWQGVLLVVLASRLLRRPVVHRTRLEVGEALELRHLGSGGGGR
mgnify:CR=1 FL=1